MLADQLADIVTDAVPTVTQAVLRVLSAAVGDAFCGACVEKVQQASALQRGTNPKIVQQNFHSSSAREELRQAALVHLAERGGVPPRVAVLVHEERPHALAEVGPARQEPRQAALAL